MNRGLSFLRYSSRALLLAGLASAALAQQPDPGMLAKLKQMYPRTQFTAVTTSPLPGLTEVVMGQNVAYVDPTGRYWFFGRLWDMQTQQDLTEPRVEQASKVNFADLPLADAIKDVRGNGRRLVAVFVDPNCGFCKKLEETMAGVTDATIYTFLLPILGPDSGEKSKIDLVRAQRRERDEAGHAQGRDAPSRLLRHDRSRPQSRARAATQHNRHPDAVLPDGSPSPWRDAARAARAGAQ